MKPLEVGRYEIKGIMEIDDAALNKIYAFINLNVMDAYLFRTQVLQEVGTDWIGARGTWPKRIARKLKATGIKISNDHLSVIGKIARESCITGENYILYIKDEVDWSQGDYADDGSCYWNSKANAKKMIKDAGGGALCLHVPDRYDEGSEEKLARCWWIPVNNSIIIFNGYTMKGDDMSLTTLSRIIMDLTEGTYYRKIGLDNRGMTDGLLWINSNSGFIIGDNDVQSIDHVSLNILPYCHDCGERFEEKENIDDYRSYCDKCWHSDRSDYLACHQCGDRVYEGDEYYVFDENYCERCYHRLFQYCQRCENDVEKGDGAEVNGEFVCNHCLRENYFLCPECDEYFHVDNAYSNNPHEIMYCQDCHDNLFTYCDMCGDHHYKERVYYLDGMNRCPDCVTDTHVRCDRCYQWTRKSEIFTMADGLYCDHCVVWREEVA